jgi:GMP synthase-like glutamine amidotransferase
LQNSYAAKPFQKTQDLKQLHSHTTSVGLPRLPKINNMSTIASNNKTNAFAVIQHHPAEGPGELQGWADARGIQLVIYRADLGQLPETCSAPVILLGGPYPALTGPAWLEGERQWLREVLALGAPVFGICLGAQMLALTLGGTMHQMKTPETGWSTVRFGNGEQLEVLQWHDDHFSIPLAATLLASNGFCPQMYSSGGTRVGMQFHPEWNADSIRELNAFFGKESPLTTVHDASKFARLSAWLHIQMDNWIRLSVASR